MAPTHGVTVILCRDPKPSWLEKWAPSFPSVVSLVLAVVALAFSWRTYEYNRRKDARSRQQSIRDDYWLRKVVSPNSIEPFLRFTTELRSSMPVMGNSLTQASVQGYWTENAKKLSEQTSAFQLLDLVDQKLHPEVERCIEKMEDALAVYCGGLQSTLADTSVAGPDRHVFVEVIRQQERCIFRLIHDHQAAVGD